MGNYVERGATSMDNEKQSADWNEFAELIGEKTPVIQGTLPGRKYRKVLVAVCAASAMVVLAIFGTQLVHHSESAVRRAHHTQVGISSALTRLEGATGAAGVKEPAADKLKEDSRGRGVTERRMGGPLIARSVTLSILAKEFLTARASLEALLERHHGYAANLTVNTQQGSTRSLAASLRVPVGELGAAVAELRALGSVENESQIGEEVTEQHSDLVARLKNSRETEQRLQAVLRQRTGKMADVLEVEQEISRVRGEIEGMEAELKGLEHRVDFATVDLTINEEYRAELGAPSLSNRFRNALVNGFQSAADMVVGMLLFGMNYAPSLLLWVAILFVPGRFVWKRWHSFLLRGIS
jgi:DNA-binding transcriptional regulator YhcF (GntR family)